MGKRSNFARVERDYYRTWDARALPPLLPFVQGKKFYEPCSGAGDLIDQLVGAGLTCIGASDIEPQSSAWPVKKDALTLTLNDVKDADLIITNPVWDRPVFHQMVAHFSALKPTWVLIDSNWLNTQQSIPYLPWLRSVVSIGRLRWIPDTKMDGKDDCSWLLFDQKPTTAATTFYGRIPRK